MAKANYTVANLSNRTIEIDGVQWAKGQIRNMIFITSSVEDAQTKGFVSITKITVDDAEIALDTASAVITNNTVQAPFNTKDL